MILCWLALGLIFTFLFYLVLYIEGKSITFKYIIPLILLGPLTGIITSGIVIAYS